jgi:hypothetical protein
MAIRGVCAVKSVGAELALTTIVEVVIQTDVCNAADRVGAESVPVGAWRPCQ